MGIQRLAEKIFYRLDIRKFHQEHKNDANKAIKNIESELGKTDPKLFKLCDEYAKDIFGWIGYSPWLKVYSAYNGVFKEGWIPDNFYARKVLPAIKGDYAHIAKLKPLSSIIFTNNYFPDSAYHVNGLWYTQSHKILNKNELKDHIFKTSQKIVFKSDKSIQGKGIYFFDKDNFDINKFELLGNGVVQNYIHQHKFFDEITPNSVATLRITSIIDEIGNPSVRGCYLRLARNKDTHVIASSSIRIPVDINTGELSKKGLYSSWLSVDYHPDSHISFANKKVPNYDKCISAVKELHRSMPYNRCIGWDLTIDNDNQVKVMEWNGNHNGIKLSEATQGPCFADLGWEKFIANSTFIQ
ncbi:MAG TPA: sugar-transfer associated ATP-grasp domain-containing protein [Anditalea sp.]|nr:sugar-transfer associated ATP-grasp domain-containing protein [Anditalea sp.]